jgi:hypothetical protein
MKRAQFSNGVVQAALLHPVSLLGASGYAQAQSFAQPLQQGAIRAGVGDCVVRARAWRCKVHPAWDISTVISRIGPSTHIYQYYHSADALVRGVPLTVQHREVGAK